MTGVLIIGAWILGLLAYGCWMLPPWRLPQADDLDGLAVRLYDWERHG